MCSSNTPRQSPEDILIQITVCNRGPEAATLHVLPTLWFRNTWSWSDGSAKPSLEDSADREAARAYRGLASGIWAIRFLYCEGEAPLLFTENETNNERLFRQAQSRAPT